MVGGEGDDPAGEVVVVVMLAYRRERREQDKDLTGLPISVHTSKENMNQGMTERDR